MQYRHRHMSARHEEAARAYAARRPAAVSYRAWPIGPRRASCRGPGRADHGPMSGRHVPMRGLHFQPRLRPRDTDRQTETSRARREETAPIKGDATMDAMRPHLLDRPRMSPGLEVVDRGDRPRPRCPRSGTRSTAPSRRWRRAAGRRRPPSTSSRRARATGRCIHQPPLVAFDMRPRVAERFQVIPGLIGPLGGSGGRGGHPTGLAPARRASPPNLGRDQGLNPLVPLERASPGRWRVGPRRNLRSAAHGTQGREWRRNAREGEEPPC